MAFSLLCQWNGGCMGCCGNNYPSVKLVARAISDNTREFNSCDSASENDLLRFRDRALATNLRYGVCRNLIVREGKMLCPLHPLLNKGKDLRIGHCDVDYFCETALVFAQWNDLKKKNFLEFIDLKKLNNISYSLKMVEGELLNEFERG